MDQIEAARKAHSSIGKYQQGLKFDLKSSPIILNKPRHHILHPVGSSSENASSILLKNISSEDLHSLKEKGLVSKNYNYETEERSIPGRLWEEWGDHELLMQELEIGWVPSSKWDTIPLYQHHADIEGRTPTHIEALEVAKIRGYSIPQEYLQKNDISRSEFLAYRASHDLILNHYCHTLGYNANFPEWKEKLIFFTGQFIIPDPLNKNKTPYIIDQLWVVRTSNTQVRLIGLEIDGEYHFQSEENILRDRERDIKLAATGYEIYHVAGWWCRIDPMRVIHEFLQTAGIFPDAINKLIGCHWQSIDDYRCGICNQPIVRHEGNWFEQIEHRNSIVIAHPSCAENYCPSDYYD
ncbi:MAG: hypothetical protein KME38_04790 [Spirirestis rafaelensis WJT71-NPBG6]|jgi:hypothetical protein|nr:hypothetical protein [Spirirestis rafaelensis WJT71-NPBG6]